MKQPPRAEAIARATGIGWNDWTGFLDAADGRRLPHADLAVAATDRLLSGKAGKIPGNAEWWGQSIAVAYEQHIGRRVPGQSSMGDFHVTVTKTVPGDLDAVLRAWLGVAGEVAEFGGVPVQGPARVSITEKWRYWRIKLADGSRVSVDIGKKSAEKSSISINHTRLETADSLEDWRGTWRGILDRLS